MGRWPFEAYKVLVRIATGHQPRRYVTRRTSNGNEYFIYVPYSMYRTSTYRTYWSDDLNPKTVYRAPWDTFAKFLNQPLRSAAGEDLVSNGTRKDVLKKAYQELSMFFSVLSLVRKFRFYMILQVRTYPNSIVGLVIPVIGSTWVKNCIQNILSWILWERVFMVYDIPLYRYTFHDFHVT